jgi:hypothetical protein
MRHPRACECGESNSDFKLGKLTRYLYATLAGLLPDDRHAVSGVGIDLFHQNLFGRGADHLLANLAALEEQQRWDVVDAVFLGQLTLLVDVYLDDFDLGGKFTGDFIQQGGDSLAWATPFGPKIDYYELIGLNHFALEIEGSYGRYLVAHYR